ncbi:tannase/feruloyl esterase family alpha/beta hydrolase [Tardiphaga sp. 215_C5_N2_1]|uniref:tannase/feruloyl esterase family alpha/beta hydrolase n=1 Tax=Tardiphaga sp. 215_C5_N2_1 TaxID=3240774 RepID=UPI003F8AAC6B
MKSARLIRLMSFMAAGFGHSALAADTVTVRDVSFCQEFRNQRIAEADVVNTEFVAEGTPLPPLNIKAPVELCRVQMKTASAPGSGIKLEVWLPTDWNGKFVGLGGGGFEGGYSVATVLLPSVVRGGYAGVMSDAGHDVAPHPEWAVDAPVKVADYGHRANHLAAVIGKAVVAAYYGRATDRAYFSGCSNGGRDALMLAQRYPEDYDLIAVGAPANDFTGLMASFVEYGKILQAPDVNLSAPKLELLHQRAIAQCDAMDGVKDGLIAAPERCNFDPGVLQCPPREGGVCLRSSEIAAVKHIYAGVRTSTNDQVMPGLPIGSEYEWEAWLTKSGSLGAGMGLDFYRYMVLADPDWTPSSFELDRDLAVARNKLGPVLDAVDVNLSQFLERGGKLLMYHGWDDAAIPARNSLKYFSAMQEASGELAPSQTRLFMVPGMAHCGGGRGPSMIGYLAELRRWDETGTASDRLIATQPDNILSVMLGLETKTMRSRPVCAYPRVARYKGDGSVENPDNYLCE